MTASMSAEQRAGLKQLLGNLKRGQELFRPYVLPIYEDDERGRPSVFGSALVVEHCGSIFLVTAKHVLAPLATGTDLYVYSKPTLKRHLGGQIVWNTSDDNADTVDVAVLRLDGDELPPYPEVNCRPLASSLLAPGAAPRDGKYYLAIGYPATKSKVNMQSKAVTAEPYANFGPAISTERLAKLGLDPHLHIAVAFHKHRVLGAAGITQTFPDPAGMSGSPLFLIFDTAVTNIQRGAFKVAGTLIEYRAKQQILLATDISVAIEMMNRCLT